MDVKLAAGIAGTVRRGEVAAFCRDHGISRQTFYKWRRRYTAAGGPEGLVELSRRPNRVPSRLADAVEDEIVRVRKQLADGGLDAGAWSIREHLVRSATITALPSVSTIWRKLVDRGLITPAPNKRPRPSWRRFCWERPNDLWQIDATHSTLANGSVVEIINIIDDHSRVCAASLAVKTCTSRAAWDTVELAASSWALPARLLSDNARAFNSSRIGRTVSFEANVRAAGILPIASSPYHPQTCGKVERFHQTLKKWLAARTRARTIAELQRLLDAFVAYYNAQRPHRALRGATPAETWHATPKAVPANHPITDTTTVTRHIIVTAEGAVRITGREGRHAINIGVAYAGLTVTVCTTGNDCVVFHDGHLVRALTIDPTRYHQRSGNLRGGPRQPRLAH